MTEKKKIREVLPHGTGLLRAQCVPVPDGYDLAKLFDELDAAMRFPLGIGLAAPQIGETVRALVVRVPHGRGEVVHHVANPEIYYMGGGTRAQWEGCLSFPTGYRALVSRFRHIKVRGLDRNGEPINFGARDMLARVLQHEIDHLDGKLMVDDAVRIDDGKERRRRQQSGGRKGIDIGG